VGSGTIRALVIEQRTMLAKTDMAKTTRTNWAYYLRLIEEEHGLRLVSELRKAHVDKIRDAMAETPGKANSYISKLRAMLDFACERDWISANPAAGVPSLPMGEHDPWPADVLEAALNAADPMLRLAIVTGLCSGQRLSDVIRMQHGWHNGKIMEVRSKKTETKAAVPMHPIWLAEIAKV
jgi:integrase